MAIPIRIDGVFMKKALEKEICSKIVLLLESKHLYQSVEVDFHGVRNGPSLRNEGPIPRGSDPGDAWERLNNSFTTKPWSFAPEVHDYPGASAIIGSSSSSKVVRLTIPTIKIPCNQCNAVRPPHNSGFKDLHESIPELTFEPRSIGDRIVQLFFLPFQCQSCRGEPLIFVVRRCGTKLKIVGRSQFEDVQVPKFIPKQEQEYYSDAIIAFQTGRILAALFYFRTLVEQYFRRVLNTNERISGEELGEKYAALLDDEFPKKFTPLKTVYQELSAKLHSAEKDEKQYEKSLADVDKHFDLLQHLPLKNRQPEQSLE